MKPGRSASEIGRATRAARRQRNRGWVVLLNARTEGRSRRSGPGPDGFEQLPLVDGLWQVLLVAGSLRELGVFCARVRRERDGRNARAGASRADGAHERVAVDLRHPDVADDDVERAVRIELLEGLPR